MTAVYSAPKKLKQVFDGKAEVRGAFGGRGSGKTRSFSNAASLFAYNAARSGDTGQVVCAREFMNSLEESSFAEIKACILESEVLKPHFVIGEKYIRTAPHLAGRVDFTFAGLNRNIGSLKSKSRILLCWVDEAEGVDEKAWQVLMPTVREEGSEIWVTWNPERKGSATDLRFRQNPPESSKIVEMNWRDNPWFDKTRLASQRLEDLRNRPSTYDHIWEGGYSTALERSLIKRHWFKIQDDFPREAGDKTRYWDLASTELSKANKDPDFTAGCLMHKHGGQYFITGMEHFRETPLGNENRIKSAAGLDGRGVPIWIQKDPGQAGKSQIDHYARNVLQGYSFRGHDKGRTSKVAMADPFAAACEAGNVIIVRRTHDGFGLTETQIEKFLAEVELFPNGPHDDQMDAASGAFDRLNANVSQGRRRRARVGSY